MSDDDIIDSWFGDFQLSLSTDDMNRLIMDYLISAGYRDAAEKFCSESGLPLPTQEASCELDSRLAIRQAILDGHLEQAVKLINDFLPELLDDDRYLHFHLLQQQLIELIRQGNIDGALKFAQDYLVEKGEQLPKTLEETEKTLALLAFEKPDESPFGYLLSSSHRTEVAIEVNSAILNTLSLPAVPRLHSLVQMVLWMQQSLDKRQTSYPKMTDVGTAKIIGKGRGRLDSIPIEGLEQRRNSRRNSPL